MVGQTVPPHSDAVQIAGLLDSPEIDQFVTELAATRWTGRPGYPIRTMVGMALTKSIYTLPTWTRTVALVAHRRPGRRARRPAYRYRLPLHRRRAEHPSLLPLHRQTAGVQAAAGRLPRPRDRRAARAAP